MARTIIIILAIAFVPILINLVSLVAVQGINATIQGIKSLFDPFSMSGDARLGGVIKLCLYLIAITFLVRFLYGTQRRG
jgi:uncharacterized membrane protein HdeD (DUF308 family)